MFGDAVDVRLFGRGGDGGVGNIPDAGGRIPHMGWNEIRGLKSGLFDGVVEGEMVYFVHSYCVPVGEYSIATCDYQIAFSAAIRKGNFWGCQFHPEKSAGVGEKIIENFLKM